MTRPTIIVADAKGSAAADKAAIDAGIPSRALMQRAGAACAAEITHRYAGRLDGGVVVVTGSGNNGGDGWVIARALHAVGVRVRVVEAVESRTPDAMAERALAIAHGVTHGDALDSIVGARERIVVDAVLGTGLKADAPLTGAVATAVATLIACERDGASVVAVDVPSGLDATNGMHVGAPRCDLTLTFGTIKRGQLVARDRCGEIVLLDIGLGTHTKAAGDDQLATAAWFREQLPAIDASAHKGTRKKIAIIGGGDGMAGAAVLAARGALRSGAGMVKCLVHRDSVVAIQRAEPSALTGAWAASDEELVHQIGEWADAVLIGPGLGKEGAREMVERVLRVFAGPVVLDADALNAFAGEPEKLGAHIGSREALITPHPAEFARLSGGTVDDTLEHRFTAPRELASRVKAAVLLKGVPTTVSAKDGRTTVIAEGTPILGTGGAGDILGGVAVTLLAQLRDAAPAGSLAAFAHGRAASLVSARQVRGYALEDVVNALPDVWSLEAPPARYPVLSELPVVGESDRAFAV